MRQLLVGTILATVLLAPAAQGADVTRSTRVAQARTVLVQPDRPIARLADQGLGYSVVHLGPGAAQRAYRVHVTCAIDESFVQTYCPTPAYVSACPRARITCADATAAGEVRALRLRY